ncbi:2-hydroxyacyl-CoA dehydratase [bacterium]|nr:2-hydroxyacyl-CoA dehydratase [bacterium]
MTALEELKSLPERKDNPYIAQWKAKGGRIVGYTCHYAPAEIIHAAGIFPYRMEARGCTETGLADVYYHRFNCTYSRCLLQEGLAGRYDFLDGLCFLNGCEQIRRMYEVWDKHIPATDYQYMVTLPHSIYDEGFEWYLEEIRRFSENIRSDFAPRLTAEELAGSIEVYNESKRLVKELYDMRKGETVPIKGSDALKLVLAAGIMPRERYNMLMEEALSEIRKQDGISDYKARVMVGGSELDNPELFEMIEDLGGLIVTDTLCSGSRSFQDRVATPVNGNAVEAIARSYYYSNPCPRMMGHFVERLAYTEKTAKEANVDGIILQKIVFCDNHAVDSTMLADELEPKGIPVLNLDRDHMLSDTGRLRTRIEAFIERISRR